MRDMFNHPLVVMSSMVVFVLISSCFLDEDDDVLTSLYLTLACVIQRSKRYVPRAGTCRFKS